MTKEKKTMVEKELLHSLRTLDTTRALVQNLDNALSLLTPEERLVANLLLLQPCRKNIARVTQALQVEESTVYRRRKKVIHKLLGAMGQAPQ